MRRGRKRHVACRFLCYAVDHSFYRLGTPDGRPLVILGPVITRPDRVAEQRIVTEKKPVGGELVAPNGRMLPSG
jgi:hypothetical protein